MLQQFDGILHGHQAKPTYAIVMEAKTSIHPTNFNDVLAKVARFKSYVLRAQDYSFSSGWRPTRATETTLISARNLAVDNHTVYTPTLYYHYAPHYT